MTQCASLGPLLVANRGEIAVRVLRTAALLGMETVAVFSDADVSAPHVRMADRAVRLGPAPARESYLRRDALLEAALATGAGAIHPGYGFLAEDPGFARAVEDSGIVFVGPTPEQLELFGVKHTARSAAADAGVPLVPGSGLLADVDEALEAAERIGYPVMVKATGGGGGIGIAPCDGPEDLKEAFERVARLGDTNFGNGAVFLERRVVRARHIEAQVLGDGRGTVVVLGDRDCSLQRRNQKVVEEAPAPNLPADVRDVVRHTSEKLCASVSYRSAGTVEFVYDVERAEAMFLEVNTRLQVEHPVTEQIYGVDLVALMLRVAAGDADALSEAASVRPEGVAMEARVCAEDPELDWRPGAGRITAVSWPAGARVDTWVEPGTEVSSAYDSLLAKVIVHARDRDGAMAGLHDALRTTVIGGIETTAAAVAAAVRTPAFASAAHHTGSLGELPYRSRRLEVVRPGTQTTVQAWPGRQGYWDVGVPPSGPMDDLSFRWGNLALGNAEGAPGLEATLEGPAIRFTAETVVCVTGAPTEVKVNGVPAPMWEPIVVGAGEVLDLGRIGPPGIRASVLVAGGLDVPEYLGSAATFTLGGIGGLGGRELREGDVLRPAPAPALPDPGVPHVLRRPTFTHDWELTVVPGPHAAPEFFRDDDLDTLYATAWQVHFNSARTGVRLLGPRPGWARGDGGDAGLHPSNIHDTPYSVGAVNFTGDLPILLGPDGPSLGGFVCPATVVHAERWKLGQLRPDDRVRFVPRPGKETGGASAGGRDRSGVLDRREAGLTPAVTYRANGDDNLLIEYGAMELDLAMRARVHVLTDQIKSADIAGLLDLTPGVRTLQVHFDPRVTSLERMLDTVGGLEESLPDSDQLEVPSRTIHLPLSWDDPVTHEATARYAAGVRADAPWCPWNIEFIRRINGLADVDEVRRIVFDATYLVLGLGDVYLGAPLAAPVDPRHRLVTTKYNPARTWTADSSVGIGGSYLCIYGMESPGGYQLVGRTLQIWNSHRHLPPFEPGVPWLLRFFDQIRWYPVTSEELLDARADFAAGRFDVRIEPGAFHLGAYEDMLQREAESIAAFRARQSAAFAAERAAWAAAGEFEPRPEAEASALAGPTFEVPANGTLVTAPMTSNVWKVEVSPGDQVVTGQPVVIIEAMKTETAVLSPCDGAVVDVVVEPGMQVSAGAPLVVLGPP
ncbi:MAG TPA: 5-oxoprolinase/urea amidolyase family protein [Acidimicrobiales bacterium]|jgi:urea carboxylase|nr:5-oxoprolinase/urea amidolyase family protein [Acidimicrobiales bacterium]